MPCPRYSPLRWWSLVLAAGSVTSGAAQRREIGPPPGLGLAAVARLDELARLRGSIAIGSVSSYDPSGGNDDGFSGRHSFLRKEGDGLVIAELDGPGVVTRIWTPTPTDDPVEFYFDGEATPRIRVPMRQLFSGEHRPWSAPLSGYGAGGYFTYLPLPYQRQLKVMVRGAKVQFFQINYARYGSDLSIRSAGPVPDDPLAGQAAEVLRRTGSDLSPLVAGGAPVAAHAVTRTLTPGHTTTLFESGTGGRIVGLRLAPASAFAGPERAAQLRIYWDGAARPAVAGPVGDLFGYAWGEPATRSLLVGTAGDTNYLYFPMPYDRSARVELALDPGGEPLTVRAEVLVAAAPRRPDEGRFYAVWRRENPTTSGRPFTFLRTRGRGHVVGAALQAQGIGVDGTPFFEGDDRVVIDGDTVVRGTGSEDAFNGGWYDVPGRWDRQRSFPLSGSLGYSNPLSRTGGYRLFLADAYAFRDGIDFTIEHGTDTANAVPTDYTAVTWFYAEREPALDPTEPGPAERRVRDPDRIALNPGWVSPIHSFSLRFASLTKKAEPGIGRYLSLVADSATTDFGLHGVDLVAPVALSGRYRVSIQTVNGPAQGMVQLFDAEQPVGSPVDMYAPRRSLSGLVPLGTLDLPRGETVVRLKLTGRNPLASRLALDLFKVVLEWIGPDVP